MSACSCSLGSRPPPHLSCSQHTAITTDLTDGAQEQLLLYKVKDSQGEHACVWRRVGDGVRGWGGTSPDTLSGLSWCYWGKPDFRVLGFKNFFMSGWKDLGKV